MISFFKSIWLFIFWRVNHDQMNFYYCKQHSVSPCRFLWLLGLLLSLSLTLWVSAVCIFFSMSSFLICVNVLVLDFSPWGTDPDDRGLIPTHKTETLVPYRLHIPMYLCHLNNSRIHRHLIHIPLILKTSSPTTTPPPPRHCIICFVDPRDIRLLQL